MAVALPLPIIGPRLPARRLVVGLCAAVVLVLAVFAGARLLAQIEGERGIAPLATSTDIMVSGIEVNTTGKTASEARNAGWKLAIRKAWEKAKGPAMSDGQLDSMVAAVVVEREQIGPRRYVATLGVIFDRARAGQF
ncbi:MAG TPA: heavy-metal-associated domain-containing protein, partial [Novosphingobium sp.]|nr:heavy-metal-associated domain-containing protein [Novosphingobium sp.]